MAVLWWICCISVLGFIYCYDNLSRLPSTLVSQSSTYNYTKGGTHIFRDAANANDGRFGTAEADCAHTAPEHSKAWFQVDLGAPYSLKSINITYRDEGDTWKPYRFRQFYLDVANESAANSLTAGRFRCYKDNTTNNNIPPNVIDIPCKQTARYVIVETTYDAPNDFPTIGAILEICEIEVYGCQLHRYGKDCESCGDCKYCDIATGCICPSGYYGPSCIQCSKHCRGESCNGDDGSCDQGCIHGYYGKMCNNLCNSSCRNGSCNQDGSCIYGCINGFYGSFCNSSCSSYCINNVCGQVNGDCTCIEGWAPPKCDRCDSTYFGGRCEHRCSDKCQNRKCDAGNGGCLSCNLTNYGSQCQYTCTNCDHNGCASSSGVCFANCMPGFWGSRCENSCGKCMQFNQQVTCNKNNGNCFTACEIGFHGLDCTLSCSPQCISELCERGSGNCDQGCRDGYYGGDCKHSCPTNCKNNICNRDSGTCTEGCNSRYFGNDCNIPCLRSAYCLYNTCHRQNGTCNQGCIDGWQEPHCNVSTKRVEMLSDDDATTMIGAGVGGVVVIIIGIIIVVAVLRLRHTKRDDQHQRVAYESNMQNNKESGYSNFQQVSVEREDETEEPYEENPEEAVYYNNLISARDILVSDLPSIIKHKEANENEGFIKEFKTLPYGERFDCHTAKLEENMTKNRFKTTFPYDHSRVILETTDDFTSDYINANYIGNIDGDREYIASQGPRINTVVDQWRMIWQEHIEYIVMLTNLIEGPRVKCQQYWPGEDKELDIDPFCVTLVEEKVYAYFIIRRMSVRKKGVITGSRTVTQFHFTRWPDHGTPNPLNLLVFHRQFRHKIKPSQHPILVHCSAGIGRTGTFIALDVLSRYGEKRGKVNVVEYVKAMRKDRMTMIQNADQYAFLYHALYEFFRRKGKLIEKDDFLKLYRDIEKQETRKRLTDEFNELTSLKPQYSDKDFKTAKKYPNLNMTKSVLPVERYLVYLTSNIHGREPYYNAVSVSSFSRAKEFISSQLPVSGAAIDLVRLLLDQESSFLISLNPLDDVKELKDWVTEEIKTIKLNPYEIIKDKQSTLSKEIRKTTIQIKGKEKNANTHKVHIFECLNWKSNEKVPAEPSTLTNVIKQFALDRKSDTVGHITVISKDGATCCGVFCAVYNAIEQLQVDDEVDILTIVQQLQLRRPEMISTKEEYEFCFKAVCDYLSGDSVYANT